MRATRSLVLTALMAGSLMFTQGCIVTDLLGGLGLGQLGGLGGVGQGPLGNPGQFGQIPAAGPLQGPLAGPLPPFQPGTTNAGPVAATPGVTALAPATTPQAVPLTNGALQPTPGSIPAGQPGAPVTPPGTSTTAGGPGTVPDPTSLAANIPRPGPPGIGTAFGQGIGPLTAPVPPPPGL